MPDGLAGLLEKADLAIGASSRVIDAPLVELLAKSVRLVRLRLDFPEELRIVGLAGGTGSGKSSLLNAIAGEEVAEVGGVRPTTDEPLAAASKERLAQLRGYLENIGIVQLVDADVGDDLCLIDLPDTDSVEIDHRLRVDALLPALDAVVWVVDPEKYRDASLHAGLIRPLADQGSHFVFAFNQIDRVAEGDHTAVLADFEQALREDGVDRPVVVATAASPGTGPPEGIDDLLVALDRIDASSVVDRAIGRIEDAGRRLLAELGETGLEFDREAGATVEAAAVLVSSGDSDAAVDRLTSFLMDTASEIGGAMRGRAVSLVSAVPSAVQRSHEAGTGSDSPRESIAGILRRDLIEPMREILRARAEALAAAADLSLSVATLRSGGVRG